MFTREIPTRDARKRDAAFVVALVVVHAALAIFAMVHHEMWRDELHSWLVGRDAATPWAAVHSHRYDGHPPLWYVVLWVITRATWNPLAMQVLHLMIASANVYVVARHAPFPKWMRALFVLGYFMTYEYAAISRCYGLALLFVLVLCVNHPRRFERPIFTGTILALLAMTTTVATAVAAAYAATLAIERVRAWRGGDHDLRKAIPIALAALGGAIALACAWPPPDSTVAHVGTAPDLPWSYAPTRILAGMIPIPRPEFFFWNSNILLSWSAFERVAPLASIALAAWIAFVLRSSAVLFAIGAVLLMFLFGAIYSGDVRHHGFFFVLFVMGAWLTWTTRSRFLAPTLGAILIAQLPGTPIALALEHRYIFSSGKRAVEALRSAGLDRAPIVAELDYPATAIVGQLGPGAYATSVRNGKPFSFVQWTGNRLWDPSDEQIVAFATGFAKARGTTALVTTRPLAEHLVAGAVSHVADFSDSMIPNENFFVYRVDAR